MLFLIIISQNKDNYIRMDKIVFSTDIHDCVKYVDALYLPHIFIIEGTIEFSLNDRFYSAGRGTCVIPTIAKSFDFVRADDEFKCRIMFTHLEFIDSIRMNVEYNTKGHLDLIDNPVITLFPSEMETCLHNLDEIEFRCSKPYHLYYGMSVKKAFQLFVLDMYDIHSRKSDYTTIRTPSAHIIVRKFINLLESGEFKTHRQPSYYAEKLNITPGYLTEACKQTTNRKPTYWIDIYMANDIRSVLKESNMSIKQIGQLYEFQSDSYFNRYCQKVLGESPLKVRKRL